MRANLMTDDQHNLHFTSRSADDPAEPVEVRRFGPPPAQPAAGRYESDPRPAQAVPAWSTRPPLATSHGIQQQRRGLGGGAIVAVAVVAGIVSGSLSAAAVTGLLRGQQLTNQQAAQEPLGQSVSQVHLDESSAVISAVQSAMPAVVKIQSSSGGLGGSGVGTGFIYHSDGWILTNRHVVADANQITVILSDTTELEGEVYGIDTLTDLAIVKVDATDLPTVKIGSSADLEQGQLAIAIGNPLGQFENTVTTGIVSGLGRQIVAGSQATSSSEQLNNLIQTDAAINPGNSGGPLLDSAGQVIGVNTAVSQDAQGIGFAIPIDIARPIMQQAVNGQPLQRPWIGIYYRPITKQLAEEMDLVVEDGVIIDSTGSQPAVFPNSPAAAAGLQPGDVITALDGQEIDADTDLAELILPHNPGDTITLRVLRGDSPTEIEVTLGTLPEEP
jgi:S1-C subfamily serine protease